MAAQKITKDPGTGKFVYTDIIGKADAPEVEYGKSYYADSGQPYTPPIQQPKKPKIPLIMQPQRPSSGNPLMDLIGNDPESAALYNQAMQASKLGTKNAMETLNQRGILNSSITSDRVIGQEQEATTNIMATLYQLQEQKKQQEINNAYNRLNAIGYADNDVAKVLGIPVGTPSASYSLQTAQLTGSFNGQPTMAGQKNQLESEYQSLVNRFYPQIVNGQINEQQLRNQYQTLVNQGYPAQQAAQLAAQYANVRQSDASIRQGDERLDLAKQDQTLSEINSANSYLNNVIQSLNRLYTTQDSFTGETYVNPELQSQLRAAIIAQGLPDSDTDKLLAYYGLPIN